MIEEWRKILYRKIENPFKSEEWMCEEIDELFDHAIAKITKINEGEDPSSYQIDCVAEEINEIFFAREHEALLRYEDEEE